LPYFYDVYGEGKPSAVANSQLHYGTPIAIAIEEQPLHRGIYAGSFAVASFFNFGVKTLVSNFGKNDFGDTHSLVLLLDSLSVQSALARLDANFMPEKFAPIMEAATNAKEETILLSQGKSEGDALENLVNALAYMFNIKDSAGNAYKPKLKGDTRGNTWHVINDEDGYTGRESLHEALEKITDSSAYKALENKSNVVSIGDLNISESAKNNFGQFLALQALSPFYIDINNEAALNKLKSTHEAIKELWEKDVIGRNNGDENFSYNYTDQWYSDRADLLVYAQKVRTENIATGAILKGAQKLHYNDMETDTDILVGVSTHRTQILFGDDKDNFLIGAGFADRLYGGAGNDTLEGKGGDDHLAGC